MDTLFLVLRSKDPVLHSDSKILFLEARILSKATKTYTCTRDKMGSKKCIKQAIRVYVPTNITFAGDDFVKERSLD